MIRHENISLFMGACIESPNLAVITSARKGPSLYESIHIKRQSIYLPNKINIARQIAQVSPRSLIIMIKCLKVQLSEK